MVILLEDLLNLKQLTTGGTGVKVKLNMYSGDHPINDWLDDPDAVNTGWLFYKSKQRHFNVGDIAVCLVQLPQHGDIWLLTTIKKVTAELNVENGVNYEGQELEEYKKYFGRIFIKYYNTSRSGRRLYEGDFLNKMVVSQILPDIYDGEHFSGYDNVSLSYRSLASIIARKKSDWIGALQNQKAVYVITDRSSGKLYIGSATGKNGMLLGRWSAYVENGHGGNQALIELVDKKGFDYVKNNFQYSILENYNTSVDDTVILERECWWKEALQSRNKSSGYNKN